MRWRRAALCVVSAGVAGCASLQEAAAPVAAAAAGQVWQYPASEFPTMCLVLKPDGSAQFVGGFLYFNPSRWRLDTARGLTVLTVGGGALPLPPMSAPAAASSATAAALRVDDSRRTIDYRIDAQTRSIDFGGFVFFRTERCSAS